MVGFAEIGSAISGLKGAMDIVKGLNAAATQAAVNEVKVELTNHIVEAQSALAAASAAQSESAERIRDLEQQLMQMKNWESEKQRYALNAIAGMGFAYILKDGMEHGEPPHWLCQPCFQSGHKHTLQYAGACPSEGGRGVLTKWQCGSCKASIRAGRDARTDDPSSWD